MINLIAASASFILLHRLLSGSALRPMIVARTGERWFRAAFALGSLAGVVWLGLAYAATAVIWRQHLWGVPSRLGRTNVVAGPQRKSSNFADIVTDYENEHGPIPGMYCEPRGFITHPHTDETIPLGTLTVEAYERPPWLYDKIVYIEKEGFNEILKAERWAERTTP